MGGFRGFALTGLASLVLAVPSIKGLEKLNELGADKNVPEKKYIIEIVDKGETLWGYSRKYGIPVSEIEAKNPRLNPENLQINQVVCIPEKIKKDYLPEHLSGEGIELIKKYEGFSQEPYLDAGKWAIGYGHQIQPGEDISKISEAKAIKLLKKDIETAENTAKEFLNARVPQVVYDLAVFASFNWGIEDFRNSTFLRKINIGTPKAIIDAIENELPRWVKSQGEVKQNLVKRRGEEKDYALRELAKDPIYAEFINRK